MTVITALELRTNLAEVFQKVSSGEEIVVKYRNNLQIKLSPFSKSKKQKSQTQKLFEYLDSENYQQILSKVSKNSILNEKSPALEKKNIRKAKLSKFL